MGLERAQAMPPELAPPEPGRELAPVPEQVLEQA
jgi:hypothetical protein